MTTRGFPTSMSYMWGGGDIFLISVLRNLKILIYTKLMLHLYKKVLHKFVDYFMVCKCSMVWKFSMHTVKLVYAL